MEECKPLPTGGHGVWQLDSSVAAISPRLNGAGEQGLTLVHFSAQPEPFLSLKM